MFSGVMLVPEGPQNPKPNRRRSSQRALSCSISSMGSSRNISIGSCCSGGVNESESESGNACISPFWNGMSGCGRGDVSSTDGGEWVGMVGILLHSFWSAMVALYLVVKMSENTLDSPDSPKP